MLKSVYTLVALFSAPVLVQADVKNAHDFAFTSISGDHLPLSHFEGKLLLVVNTASLCGFTGQYEGLQRLQDRYKDEGLVVLGVPSNDFGQQEPGTAAEIKSFCTMNYNITFPMTDKANVIGEEAHPFYQWAATQTGWTGRPKWNFHKYLINDEGVFIDWFSTPTQPMSSKITKAIEAHLPQQ